MTLQFEVAPNQGDTLSASIQEVIDRVLPGVVQVRSGGRGIGAGVIWGSDGVIITNHHVVVGENRGKIRVYLADGREFEAQVTDLNPQLDLARLQIPVADLPALPVGDSTRLRVGELTLAIGHPWGIPSVVTAGIISGLGEIRNQGSRNPQVAQYIRSDVRLAPGNSGGPLLNAEGAVIGINSMVFGGDLGIAIPSQVVKKWLAELGTTGRSYLGLGVRPVKLRILMPGDPEPTIVVGLKVANLDAGGPAERGGLQIGDVLLEVAGQRMREVASLSGLLSLNKPGTQLKAQLIRGDTILTLTLEAGRQERT